MRGVSFYDRLNRSKAILLPSQAAKLHGSDADCEGIERASCFVIQDHQTRQSQRFPMYGQRSVERHHTSQFENGSKLHLCMDEQKRPTPERRGLSLTQDANGRSILEDMVLILGMKAWILTFSIYSYSTTMRRHYYYRIYSRIGRYFFLIFFVQKLGCDLYGDHTWVKISTKSKQKRNLSAIACMHSCTHIPKQPMAQGHAPVITAYAIKPRCLLHMQHYRNTLVICTKKLRKGPFKSQNLQCDLSASQPQIQLF